MSNNNILLICSDQLESRLLEMALEQAGLTVTAVAGLESVRPTRPDLVVLVNHDGRYLVTVRALRQQFNAPLLLLVDYQTEDVHLSALREGIDLILFRPYSIRFLAAQIPVMLRRFTQTDPPDPPTTPDDPPSVVFDNFRLNTNTHTLHFAEGEPMRLSQLEFRLLQTLMSRPQQVIPIERLIERIYGYDGDEDDQLGRKLVWRLRAKLRDDGREPCFIHTVPGVGYSFHDNGTHEQCAHNPATHNPKIETRLGQLSGYV